jgi:hypothetical protein
MPTPTNGNEYPQKNSLKMWWALLLINPIELFNYHLQIVFTIQTNIIIVPYKDVNYVQNFLKRRKRLPINEMLRVLTKFILTQPTSEPLEEATISQIVCNNFPIPTHKLNFPLF